MNGVRIRSISRNSPFFRGGLRAGDRITTINGAEICDELDFQFYSADYLLELGIERNGMHKDITVERIEGGGSGLLLDEAPIRRCANRCIFCFIDQMPAGLRRSLYVKDEDVRLSLLNGNYVTMSTFKKRDLEQIARLGLSPLYISVHATDTATRRVMLGNKKVPDIMEQLDFLAENDIRFHTQIVVCPGYNDGSILKQTLKDLLVLGDALQSIAVVPVGLTRFHSNGLKGVGRDDARVICKAVSAIGDRAAVRDGVRKVFLADELFIRASLPIPENGYYEEYPQIENGVGLIRQLLDSCDRVHRSGRKRPESVNKRRRRRLVVTSVSADPFVRKVLGVCQGGEMIDTLPVANTYFGETVTVAGLLTARDVVAAVKHACATAAYHEVVLPAVMFNFAGHTLDGYSARRIAAACGKPVNVAQTIEELFS